VQRYGHLSETDKKSFGAIFKIIISLVFAWRTTVCVGPRASSGSTGRLTVWT